VKVLQNIKKTPKQTKTKKKPQPSPPNLHLVIEDSLYRFIKLFMEKTILLLDPGVLGSTRVKNLTLHNQSSRITLLYST